MSYMRALACGFVYGVGSGLSVLPRRRPEDEHIFGRAAELALLVALGVPQPGRKYAQASSPTGENGQIGHWYGNAPVLSRSHVERVTVAPFGALKWATVT